MTEAEQKQLATIQSAMFSMLGLVTLELAQPSHDPRVIKSCIQELQALSGQLSDEFEISQPDAVHEITDSVQRIVDFFAKKVSE